ncbi:MAG TPA: hypothetical protein VFG68_20980 [Fimbriiglobus sp.]|nr:hypothetical protein [Fimbriiglobus sp.]
MTTAAEPPTDSPGPPAVSRFEYNLLRILRFLLGHTPAEQAAPLVYAKFSPPPPCLSRTCVRLVQDMLGKGLVIHLVRAGGWRRERFLKGNQPVEGRVWERVPLDVRRLEFGEDTLGFLYWLAAEKPTETRNDWDAPPEGLSAADELFLAVALDALRVLPDVFPSLTAKAAFRQNPLCWLISPGDFAADEPAPPAFDPWLTGTRAAILECLQPMLTQRWVRSERGKGQVGDWRRMRQQGRAESAALAAFLAAAEKAARPDLARFVLRSASAVFTSEQAPAFWTGGLQGTGPPRLADRLETQRAALALPRQLETLQRWERRARSVGYFDDDYQASQLWKADWEAASGDVIAARAHRVLEQLEPLRT